MSQLTIREIQPGDLDAVEAFNRTVYLPGAPLFQPDFFDWQLLRCCGEDLSGGGHGALGAFRDGRVVGACVVARYPVAMAGATERGAWIHYWFTDPQEHGTGFQLLRRALSGLSFFGGARIVPAAAAVMRALGYPFLWFELERLVAVADAQATAALFEDGGDGAMCYLRSLVMRPSAAALPVETIARFGDRQDALWGELRGAFSVATERGARFMNWRYVDHPRLAYDRVRCPTPHGDTVWVWRREQVSDRPQAVARICEALGRPEALAAAFPSVFRAMAAEGVAFADFSCSNADVLAALVQGGMVPAVTRPGLDFPSRLRPLETYLSKRLDYYMMFPSGAPAGWTATHRTYFTKGDSNQDIPPARS